MNIEDVTKLGVIMYTLYSIKKKMKRKESGRKEK